MPQWVALLRGINVGGKNILPMKDLVMFFENQGCTNIRTYIQSGNVVFECAKDKVAHLPDKVGHAVKSSLGFRPSVQILAVDALKKAVRDNPFPKAASDPKSLHLFFLQERFPKATRPKIDGLLAASESYRVIDKVLYLHAPNGIGRSKFSNNVEKASGISMTARNWRTVKKLEELVGNSDA